MLKKIRLWLATFGMRCVRALDPTLLGPKTEDSQAGEAVKRTREAFRQQQQFINAKAQQPHSYDCHDAVTCTKPDCWRFVPDKIVQPEEDPTVYCEFHWHGGMYENLGYDVCPCQCYCTNCEMIPEDAILIRAQEIAGDMKEENVFEEFKRQFGKD